MDDRCTAPAFSAVTHIIATHGVMVDVISAVDTGVGFSDDVLSRVRSERNEGRHCLLFSGGRLVTSFVQTDLIDELTVGIVPVLLGQGRRLFREGPRRIDLRLVDYTLLNGKVRLLTNGVNG